VAQPLSFTFNSVAQEVICGSDAISGLPAVLDRLGATRAMVTWALRYWRNQTLSSGYKRRWETDLSVCSLECLLIRLCTRWTRRCC